jgi:uncharacterized protein with von Willebrand factor type A (vWA) domain
MSDPAAPDAGRGTQRDRVAPARGLVDFARALRAGGLRLGAAALLDAVAAVTAVGPERRADVRAALRATCVRDPADLALFELLFEALYAPATFGSSADPEARLVPDPEPAPRPAERRLVESLAHGGIAAAGAAPRTETDAAGTVSRAERFQQKDFEQMSAAELALARQLIAALVRARAQRRSRRSRSGGPVRRVDLRAMVRHHNLDQTRYRTPLRQPRDAVLLVDISGSMSVYSRLFLHFAHAMSRCPGRVETFVFATRLSRITRPMHIAEPDVALAAAGRAAADWDGGTRLGASLGEFNLHWARRVLGAGARVILLSDGLERDDIDLLEREVARLARWAHELIWINPLLRSPGYAPLAAGARVLAAHADTLRPAHNLASLAELVRLID